MSTTPTSSIQGAHPAVGTQAPSQIELAWERYKSLFYVVVFAILGALVVNYGYKKYKQSEADKEWSTFATSLGMDVSYTDQTKAFDGLTERLDSVDAAKLKELATKASEPQRPFLQLAIARKAMLDKDWAAAEAALKELETRYPNHLLVRSSAYPIQAQDRVKEKEPEAAKPQAKPKKPEFKPAVAGSVVSLMRAQIEAAKTYTEPPQFAKQTIPANAIKVKFELGDHGSFTIALMSEEAPELCKAFLALAEAEKPIWVGLAIDEIHRPTKTFNQPRELHLGLESTRDEDKSKWKDTDPSKNLVDFESNKLSHFAGAVSARTEADGKSAVDRFWVAVDDASRHDGEREIFAYVIEGLEDLKKITELSMSVTQEEDRGQGKPSDTIRVTKVTVIKP
jgi:cyclophilin family peptidyl-prolyl cis-trans isomerase